MKGVWVGLLFLLLGFMVLIPELTWSLAASQPSSAQLDSEKSPSSRQAVEAVKRRAIRDLEQALAKVQPLLDHYGYPAVFLAIMVEGIGLLAPGQTLLIAAALTAARGGLNIVWVLIVAGVAAIVGNTLGYLIGRWGGRPLLHKIKVNERHLQKMEGYFTRYGRGLVLIARFFDGLRQLNGIVAGMLKMPWQVFTTFNILDAVLWTGVWGLGTYFLEKKIASLHLSFQKIEPWVAGFCVLSFLALLVYLLRHDRKKG
jgi:membrane protein DedA with SNARE-associated domain